MIRGCVRCSTTEKLFATNKEILMNRPGVPVEGLSTVGQIDATNPLVFRTGQNGMEIAVALLSTHTAGAPVVDS